MAGDKKGKWKAVVEGTKKRSRDEREWDRALAVVDAADQPQRSLRIRGSEAKAERQGGHSPHHSYAAQRILALQRQLSPHRLLVVVHGPKGVLFRGEGLAHSHSSRLSSSQRVAHI